MYSVNRATRSLKAGVVELVTSSFEGEGNLPFLAVRDLSLSAYVFVAPSSWPCSTTDHMLLGSFCLASVGASVDGDQCIEELVERIDRGVVLVAVVRFPGVAI